MRYSKALFDALLYMVTCQAEGRVIECGKNPQLQKLAEERGYQHSEAFRGTGTAARNRGRHLMDFIRKNHLVLQNGSMYEQVILLHENITPEATIEQ